MTNTNTNIEIIEVTPENAEEKFQEFYDTSALTFFGCDVNEAHLYRDFFKELTEIDKTKPCYLVSGGLMNDYYGLTGRNAYPRDLHILVFKLDTFKEPMKICIARFQIGGRWFDDVVENNRMHQEG